MSPRAEVPLSPTAEPLRRVALRSFAVGLALTASLLAAVVWRVHDGVPTGPFLIGSHFSNSPGVWPLPVEIVDGPGFDGQFYLALAFDPLLRGPLTGTLDDVRYRGRRIFGSAAARLLGFGRSAAIPWAFLALTCLAAAGGGAIVGAWAVEHGGSWAWSIVAVCAIGNLVCIERALIDGLQCALLLAAAACAARGAPRLLALAVVFFALAVLQKETTAIALPLVLVPLLKARSPRLWAVAVAAAAAVCCWWLYVESRATSPVAGLLAINFDIPGRGWTVALLDALGADKSWTRKAKDVLFLGTHLLAVTAGLRIGVGSASGLLRREAADGLALAVGFSALLVAALSFNLWREVWGYARTALPLVLLLLIHSLREDSRGERAKGLAVGKLVAVLSALGGIGFALANVASRTA